LAKVAKSHQSVTIKIKLEPNVEMFPILPVMYAVNTSVNKFPIN